MGIISLCCVGRTGDSLCWWWSRYRWGLWVFELIVRLLDWIKAPPQAEEPFLWGGTFLRSLGGSFGRFRI